MSHFTVMVIGEDPEGQLEPYDENLEMEERLVGEVSEDEIKRFVEYYAEHKNADPNTPLEQLYDEYGYDWNSGVWRKNEETGKFEEFSTWNEDSRWDWYILGGRWSGEVIKLKEGAKGEEGEPGVFQNKVGVDRALRGDIANFEEIDTHAIVKDGVWYEDGKMGWWSIKTTEKSEWEEQRKELLSNISDDTMISIYDCHT